MIDWILGVLASFGTIGIVISIVAGVLLLTLVVSILMGRLYYVRWKNIEKEKKNITGVFSVAEASYKAKVDTLEGRIKKKDEEIVVLRIEVDANVEQLSQQRSNNTLREDQIEKIREIIGG